MVPKKSLARSATVRVGTPDFVAQVPASFLLASLYRASDPVAFTAGLSDGVELGLELGVVPGLLDSDGVALAGPLGLGSADDGAGTAVGGGSSTGGVLAHPARAAVTAAAMITEVRAQLPPVRGALRVLSRPSCWPVGAPAAGARRAEAVRFTVRFGTHRGRTASGAVPSGPAPAPPGRRPSIRWAPWILSARCPPCCAKSSVGDQVILELDLDHSVLSNAPANPLEAFKLINAPSMRALRDELQAAATDPAVSGLIHCTWAPARSLPPSARAGRSGRRLR